MANYQTPFKFPAREVPTDNFKEQSYRTKRPSFQWEIGRMTRRASTDVGTVPTVDRRRSSGVVLISEHVLPVLHEHQNRDRRKSQRLSIVSNVCKTYYIYSMRKGFLQINAAAFIGTRITVVVIAKRGEIRS